MYPALALCLQHDIDDDFNQLVHVSRSCTDEGGLLSSIASLVEIRSRCVPFVCAFRLQLLFVPCSCVCGCFSRAFVFRVASIQSFMYPREACMQRGTELASIKKPGPERPTRWRSTSGFVSRRYVSRLDTSSLRLAQEALVQELNICIGSDFPALLFKSTHLRTVSVSSSPQSEEINHRLPPNFKLSPISLRRADYCSALRTVASVCIFNAVSP